MGEIKDKIDYIINVINEKGFGINARSIVFNVILGKDITEISVDDFIQVTKLLVRYFDDANSLSIMLLDKYNNNLYEKSFNINEIEGVYDILNSMNLMSKEDALKSWSIYQFECSSEYTTLYGRFVAKDEDIDALKGKTLSLGEKFGKHSDDYIKFNDRYYTKETDNILLVQLCIDLNQSFGYNPLDGDEFPIMDFDIEED